MYKSSPQTSHSAPSSHRTLTESLPPIQGKVAARLAADQAREPKPASSRGKATRVVEMDAGIQDRLSAVLRDRDGASPSADPAAADQARDAALARFTTRELAVQYTARGKAYTLRELIHMLFDPASDASRSHAAAFLAPVLA
ncbi:MAG TPA: hypothetical protein VLM79_14610 [Kofleriaceae bacterium]|nr:hypothetical protein [Kofleriaceae bacterium]